MIHKPTSPFLQFHTVAAAPCFFLLLFFLPVVTHSGWRNTRFTHRPAATPKKRQKYSNFIQTTALKTVLCSIVPPLVQPHWLTVRVKEEAHSGRFFSLKELNWLFFLLNWVKGMKDFCFTLQDQWFLFLCHVLTVLLLFLFHKALRVVTSSGGGGADLPLGGIVSIHVLVKGCFGTIVRRFVEPHFPQQLDWNARQPVN
ncbi:hypothetical protein CCH79_00013545 [Gambusia affinis]|uniref:Uncharacterized protein n=1 Tax=Gambusia affinis TaxID=33528 RepID=A0A315VYM8_GAMAF|nr:hypothetical protein CCH79_00013545 [Gambusia affinis]